MTSEGRLARLEKVLDKLLEKQLHSRKHTEARAAAQALSDAPITALRDAEIRTNEELDILKERLGRKPPESAEEGDSDV